MHRMDRTTRREVVAVAVLTVVGAGLRLWGFGRLGLSHFDEGVYALAGSWSLAPTGLAGLDPMLVPYAPPGFPILVGIAYLIVGFADVSAIFVSTLCGVATIAASAWIGRRTFGPGAGAAAAALASGSLAHVAFSRKALTDSPFVLAWLVAIGLAGRFLDRPTIGRAVAVGLAVGLAQNIKYNGWLLGLLLVAAAALGVLLRAPREEPRGVWLRDVLRLIALVAIAAAVAMLVYLPWFLFVERHGGYAGLVSHHRTYLGGAGSWTTFLRQQLAQVVAMSGGPSWDATTWVVAWLAGAWARGERPQLWPRGVWAGLISGAIISAANANLGWWLGLAAAPWLVVQGQPSARLLGTWWLLLSVLTPFYHPYARLWLPLSALGWLLTAGLIVELNPSGTAGARAPRWLACATLVAIVGGVGQQWWTSSRPLPLGRFFQRTDTLRILARELPNVVPPGTELHVLARRPLAFYVLILGRYPLRLLSGPNDVERSVPPEAWVIIDGAVLDPGARSQLKQTPAALKVGERLDPVTLLDVAPGAAYHESDRGPIEIHVVRGPRFNPRLSIDGVSTPVQPQ